MAPFELDLTNTAQVCVTHGGAAPSCYTAPTSAASAGIFRNPTNPIFAAAVNQDGTINSQQNPAPAGSIISLYANGLGSLTPQPPNGALIGFPLPMQSLPIAVGTRDPNFQNPSYVPAEVLYAGPAPLEIVGVTQINVRVPATLQRQDEPFQVAVRPPSGLYSSDSVSVWVR